GSQLEVVVDANAPDRVLMAATQVASMAFAPDTGELRIQTNRGEISAVLTQVQNQSGVVVYMGGHVAGGNGPEGLYADLALALKPLGISSLRVNMRNRGGFEQQVL